MGSGPVIYASDDSEDALIEAKEYIKRFSLTQDDVAIIRRNQQTLVIAKRDISQKMIKAIKEGR